MIKRKIKSKTKQKPKSPLSDRNQELYDKVNEVLGKVHDELKNYDNLALNQFREYAQLKNRMDTLFEKISEIQHIVLKQQREEFGDLVW